MTDELVEPIFTSGSVQTRIAGALVYIAQAPSVIVAAWALTPKAVDQVNTDATVCTGAAGTLINVGLAV